MANEHIEFIKSGMVRFPEQDPGTPRLSSEAGTPSAEQKELGQGRSRSDSPPQIACDPGEDVFPEGLGYGAYRLLEQDNDDIRSIGLSCTRPLPVDASFGNRSVDIARLQRLWGRPAVAGYGQGSDRRDRAAHPRLMKFGTPERGSRSVAQQRARRTVGPRDISSPAMTPNAPIGVFDQLGQLSKNKRLYKPGRYHRHSQR
jgi:hypothetical protein